MRTFIGCGPANLFSILYLLKTGYLGNDITVFDQGEDPYIRKENDILKGFGGAGFWSDGKYIFSDQLDTTSHLFESKNIYHNEIKILLKQFIPYEQINVSYPIKQQGFDLKSFQLREAECWHLGTNKNKEVGCIMYDYMVKKGVHFYWGAKVREIDLNLKKLKVDCKKCLTMTFDYEYLQIGLGKAGTPFIKELCQKYEINQNQLPIHTGGRFETIYNEKIKELVKIQYDFKLYKKYGNIELRTFCVNNESAYVVQEKIEDRIQYNGHAYFKRTDKINNLTNFGIIAEIPSDDSLQDYNNFTNNWVNCYFKGKNWDMERSSINKLKDLTVKDYPKEKNLIPAYFNDFIEKLDELFELNGNWCFFLPEIKINSGMIDVNSDFVLKDGRFSNVSWVGDSCVGTRGIVPAAITGLKAQIVRSK